MQQQPQQHSEREGEHNAQTANAVLRRTCDFCAKRKRACTGRAPCFRCREKGVVCRFSLCAKRGPKPQRSSALSLSTDASARRAARPITPESDGGGAPLLTGGACAVVDDDAAPQRSGGGGGAAEQQQQRAAAAVQSVAVPRAPAPHTGQLLGDKERRRLQTYVLAYEGLGFASEVELRRTAMRLMTLGARGLSARAAAAADDADAASTSTSVTAAERRLRRTIAAANESALWSAVACGALAEDARGVAEAKRYTVCAVMALRWRSQRPVLPLLRAHALLAWLHFVLEDYAGFYAYYHRATDVAWAILRARQQAAPAGCRKSDGDALEEMLAEEDTWLFLEVLRVGKAIGGAYLDGDPRARAVVQSRMSAEYGGTHGTAPHPIASVLNPGAAAAASTCLRIDLRLVAVSMFSRLAAAAAAAPPPRRRRRAAAAASAQQPPPHRRPHDASPAAVRPLPWADRRCRCRFFRRCHRLSAGKCRDIGAGAPGVLLAGFAPPVAGLPDGALQRGYGSALPQVVHLPRRLQVAAALARLAEPDARAPFLLCFPVLMSATSRSDVLLCAAAARCCCAPLPQVVHLPRRLQVAAALARLAEPDAAAEAEHWVNLSTWGHTRLLAVFMGTDHKVLQLTYIESCLMFAMPVRALLPLPLPPPQLIHMVHAAAAAGGGDLAEARAAGALVRRILDRIVGARGWRLFEQRRMCSVLLAYNVIFLRLLTRDEEGALDMLLRVQGALCGSPGLMRFPGYRHNICAVAALLLSAGRRAQHDALVAAYNGAGIADGVDRLPDTDDGRARLCLCSQLRCAAAHRVVAANLAAGHAAIFTQHTLLHRGAAAAAAVDLRLQPPGLYVRGRSQPVFLYDSPGGALGGAEETAATEAEPAAAAHAAPPPPPPGVLPPPMWDGRVAADCPSADAAAGAAQHSGVRRPAAVADAASALMAAAAPVMTAAAPVAVAAPVPSAAVAAETAQVMHVPAAAAEAAYAAAVPQHTVLLQRGAGPHITVAHAVVPALTPVRPALQDGSCAAAAAAAAAVTDADARWAPIQFPLPPRAQASTGEQRGATAVHGDGNALGTSRSLAAARAAAAAASTGSSCAGSRGGGRAVAAAVAAASHCGTSGGSGGGGGGGGASFHAASFDDEIDTSLLHILAAELSTERLADMADACLALPEFLPQQAHYRNHHQQQQQQRAVSQNAVPHVADGALPFDWHS
ncbi:hypothetical protein JKP88DRAFT_295050 [Tribonema minus]|uniref:Zn(2)-C6 fungal-type domain-containing protein n=1 Tax=Tribonema minus TaxID=303371 RepID=A0A835ZID0_9STRA|nr:hypothetical protein JKP88DRAFT_295050 [Tribonema minus]